MDLFATSWTVGAPVLTESVRPVFRDRGSRAVSSRFEPMTPSHSPCPTVTGAVTWPSKSGLSTAVIDRMSTDTESLDRGTARHVQAVPERPEITARIARKGDRDGAGGPVVGWVDPGDSKISRDARPDPAARGDQSLRPRRSDGTDLDRGYHAVRPWIDARNAAHAMIADPWGTPTDGDVSEGGL
jgi:hypothetical protein